MSETTNEITRITTADADVHDIPGDIDLIRRKADNVKWLVTTDGRYVRTAMVVSMWVPTEEEIERGLSWLADE